MEFLDPDQLHGDRIVGVLHDACTRADLPSASLWAAVPAYASQVPSPKAALALVERSCEILGTPGPVARLRQEAGLAVQNGLPREVALKAITTTPARLFKVQHGGSDVGVLKPGEKDRNDPGGSGTFPESVLAYRHASVAIGGEGSLTAFSSMLENHPQAKGLLDMLDRDGDGNPLNDLGNLAKGLFGRS